VSKLIIYVSLIKLWNEKACYGSVPLYTSLFSENVSCEKCMSLMDHGPNNLIIISGRWSISIYFSIEMIIC